MPIICVRDLLLFCTTLLRFACSEGHRPFGPVRTSLSAGAISHSQYHIYMTCLMEIKREPRLPPAGVNITERIDISCRLPMMSVPSVGSGVTSHTRSYPWDVCLRASRFVAFGTSWGVELTNGAARWHCSERPSSVRSLCKRSSRGFPQERQPSFLLAIYAA